MMSMLLKWRLKSQILGPRCYCRERDAVPVARFHNQDDSEAK